MIAMADIIPLGTIPGAESARAMLLDLRRRLDSGEDIGPRIAQIRQAAASMRALAGGLRRVLKAPDERLAAEPEVLAAAWKVLALAERNVAKVEEFLRLSDEEDLEEASR
ncbi:hypothetical protein [Methylobacterium sp. yr668]|uniref:hypothetical protein n=1 Tax=Methylobacterium sp. yr668 TaxID=1761801 RepID=UPI001114F9CF|nr:hypothetical protein [Methylobacterium sp. yr668]